MEMVTSPNCSEQAVIEDPNVGDEFVTPCQDLVFPRIFRLLYVSLVYL